MMQLRGPAHQGSASCTSRPQLNGLVKSDGSPIFKRRRVTCRDTNQFRTAFQSPEPGRSNDPQAAQQPLPPVEPGTVHGPAAEAHFGVLGGQPSPYAQQRVAGEAVVHDVQAEIVHTMQELWEERGRWPQLSKDANGKWHFSPGFLLGLLEPLPPTFIVAPIQQQVLQVVVLLVYASACIWAFKLAMSANYNLALALAVNWARDKLTPLRLLTVCTLAWFGNLWLYWVFFIGARVDEVMAQIAQPLRWVCWLMFSLWLAYVFLSPVWHHPTPWFIFAPGNNPFSGPSIMRM